VRERSADILSAGKDACATPRAAEDHLLTEKLLESAYESEHIARRERAMNLKPIAKMTAQEFDAMLDQIGEQDSDMITLPNFMETLWALEKKKADEVIELTAKVVDDHIELEAPEGIAVFGNEVIVGNHRIVLRWAQA
jgi:hypothetical protein